MEVHRFVLIPESDYLAQKPTRDPRDEVLSDSRIVEKSKILPTLPKTKFANKLPETSVSSTKPQLANDQLERIIREQTQMKNRAELILRRILESPRVEISATDQMIVDGQKLPINIGTFLHKLQLTSNSKIDKKDLDNIIKLVDILDIPEQLMKNKYLVRKQKEFRETDSLNYTIAQEDSDEKNKNEWKPPSSRSKSKRRSKQKAWQAFLNETKEDFSDNSATEEEVG